VRDEIDAAQKELDGTASVPRVTQHAAKLVDGINTTVSQIDTINSTYLQPLKAFNTVVSAITDVRFLAFLWCHNQIDIVMQIHPYAKAALGLLTSAAQVRLLLAERTASQHLAS